MKFLLLFVSIVDVTLQVCFGAKALATAGIHALVVFAVISLVMFELVWLIKRLGAARFIAMIHAILVLYRRGYMVRDNLWGSTVAKVGAVMRVWRRGIQLC